MSENLVLEKKIEFDLTFAPDDIKKQYEKFLSEGYKTKKTATQTGRTGASQDDKLSLKVKLIWVAVGVFLFYLIYSKYNAYLEDKQRSELQEKEKIKRTEEDKVKNEQDKQDLEVQKNINNARVAINSADLKGVKANQESSSLLKEAETNIGKADEALKNKNYNDANLKAKEAIEKANNSIILFDELMSKAKSKENAKSQKETKKESSKKKTEENVIVEEKNKEQKSKIEDKKSEAKSEVKKDKKEKEIKQETKTEKVQAQEHQAIEKENKKSEALKNKVLELINNIKNEKNDEEKINLVKKHFSDKLTRIEGDITSIQASFDNNKFEEASKLADKILKDIKDMKNDAIKEESNSEERRKDALQKILETQKALKQKRLDKGKD